MDIAIVYPMKLAAVYLCSFQQFTALATSFLSELFSSNLSMTLAANIRSKYLNVCIPAFLRKKVMP